MPVAMNPGRQLRSEILRYLRLAGAWPVTPRCILRELGPRNVHVGPDKVDGALHQLEREGAIRTGRINGQIVWAQCARY